MSPDLPDKDFELGNLTRRQAAVFERLCERARAGIGRELSMHDAAIELPMASPSVKAEHRLGARMCRGELDRVVALHHRLQRLRSAPLTAEEARRLSDARSRRELTSAEVDRVIYGLLDPADVKAAA